MPASANIFCQKPPISNPALVLENSRDVVTGAARSKGDSDAAIDRTLVHDFVAGNAAAFVTIMERHRTKIFGITHALLRNRADAEEITQDTFIRAHRGLARFRGDASLGTWLYRIAVNLARNRYWYFFRRHRQDTLSLDGPMAHDATATFADLLTGPERDPAQESIADEFGAIMNRCMRRLDAPHREILILRNIREHTYEEIAVRLGINVGTVKSRIARARNRLRAVLSEVCPEFTKTAALGEWFLPARAMPGSPMIVSA